MNAGALLVAGIALLMLSGCTGPAGSPGVRPGGSARSSPSPAQESPSEQTLSLGSGEYFDPPPANAHPPLTAVQAWVAYATSAHARINRTHIPSGTTAKLGVFVDGGGRRHLAYGYFTPDSYPPYSGLVVPSPPVPCTEWTMLNSHTGAQIESSWFRCPATNYSPITRPRVRR